MIQPSYILDANVAIDYVDTCKDVLLVFSESIGRLHIISEVLDEVESLDERECSDLGIVLVEPTLEQVLEAGELSLTTSLSFQDWICLIVARDRNWICVTNDKCLYTRCVSDGVACIRGLVPLIKLVRGSHLSKREAVKCVRAMHRKNPRFINEEVINNFEIAIEEPNEKVD